MAENAARAVVVESQGLLQGVKMQRQFRRGNLALTRQTMFHKTMT